MKSFVVFSCLLAVAFAKPSLLTILPGAPLGADGRVVDTPEVAYAKAEHAAAHINEKIAHKQEAIRSADYVVAAPAVLPVVHAAPSVALPIVHSAPLTYTAPVAYAASHATVLAADGRPLDTPEVAIAKAAHAAAHINDKLIHAQEASRNYALY